MKKILIAFATSALLMTMGACSSSNSNKTEGDAEKNTVETPAPTRLVQVEATGDVTEVTDDSMFRPGDQVSLPTVLDFNATWCVPCRKLTPAFHQAAKEFEGKVAFYTIDIDNNKETASAFGIQSIPTVAIVAPNGTTKILVGLDPFGVTDENINSPELTDIIVKNLSEIIAQAAE